MTHPYDQIIGVLALAVTCFAAGASWGMLRGNRAQYQEGALWALAWLGSAGWLCAHPAPLERRMLLALTRHIDKVAARG